MKIAKQRDFYSKKACWRRFISAPWLLFPFTFAHLTVGASAPEWYTPKELA